MSEIFGTPGDDSLPGTSGDDAFHGQDGRDTAQIAAPSAGAVFSLDSQNRWVVTSAQGADQMDSIEVFQFSDGSVVPGTEFDLTPAMGFEPAWTTAAALSDGSFVLVSARPWTGAAGGHGLYMQRFDAHGLPVGPEAPVDSIPAFSQRTPAVAALPDGGYVVTWTAAADRAYGPNDVHVQRFDASGAAVGSELVVNALTGGDQYDNSVAALSVGGYLVSWINYPQGTQPETTNVIEIRAQRFDAAGTPTGDQVVLAGIAAAGQGAIVGAKVAGLAQGGYVAIWHDPYTVHQRRFDDSGQPSGAETLVGPRTDYLKTQAAGLADGGWIVVEAGAAGLVLTRFDSAGAQVQQFSPVLGYVSGQPAVAALPGGGFVVGWSRENDAAFVQQFDAHGSAVGAPTLVGAQSGMGSLAAFAGGGYLATWLDGGITGERFDGSGVALSSGRALFGDAGDNTIRFAGERPLELRGGDGNDVLHGGAGADTIDGGNGNDLLRGAGGDDLITGGAGFDSVALEDPVTAASWHVSVDRVLTVATPTGGTDTFSGVEQVQGAGDAVVHLGGVADLRVNADPGKQYVPRVAPLPDGGFAMTWSVVGEGAKGTWSYATTVQRFDAAGAPASPAVQLSPADTVPELPAIAGFANGEYVVAWSSNISGKLLAQRFDASGTKVGAAAVVSDALIYVEQAPEVVALTDGGYLVTWGSPDGSGQGIFSQRMDAAGSKVGGVIQVNTSGHADAAGVSQQAYPAVALLGDGGWVVTWASSDAVSEDVYAQRFDASGARVGGETLVGSSAADPDVVALRDGGFVIAWAQAGHVIAQRFDAAGSPVGGAFQADSVAGANAIPALTALPDGGWMVAWQSAWSDIYAQRFDAAGQRAGVETLVNAITSGDQRYPELATLADGSVLATWAGGTWERYVGEADIFVQRFDAGGAPDAYLTFSGGASDDVLRMGSVSQRVRIEGAAGNDVLAGASGTDDVLAGGSGNDTFEFAAWGNGADLITDWTPGDRILVAGAQFTAPLAAGDGGSVPANGVQVATTGQVTTLFIGTDDTPGAEVVIQLAGSFAAADFSASGDSIVWSHGAPPPPPGGDTNAPLAVDFFPAAGSNTLPPDWSPGITFSESVVAGAGTITLQTAAGEAVQAFDVATDPGIHFFDTSILIDPAADLQPGTTYRLIVSPDAIRDLAGNAYAGVSDYSFTTAGTPPAGGGDATAPIAVDFFPAAGSNTLPPDWSPGITFSESIQAGAGTIALQTAAGDVVQTFDVATDPGIHFFDTRILIDPAADLQPGTTYRLIVSPDAIRDLAGNAYAGVSDYSFTTAGEAPGSADTTAPVAIDFFPAPGSNTLPPDWSPGITFSEDVQAGSGTITLQTAAGEVVQTFGAMDPGIRYFGASVLIDPAADLLPGTTYRLIVGADAFEDLAGNAYAGVSDYSFTTSGGSALAALKLVGVTDDGGVPIS